MELKIWDSKWIQRFKVIFKPKAITIFSIVMDFTSERAREWKSKKAKKQEKNEKMYAFLCVFFAKDYLRMHWKCANLIFWMSVSKDIKIYPKFKRSIYD